MRAAWTSGDWSTVLRRYRRAHALSQSELGERLGLTQGAVSLIETGKRNLETAAVIDRVADALGVPSELRSPQADEWWLPTPSLGALVAAPRDGSAGGSQYVDHIAEQLANQRRKEDGDGRSPEIRAAVRSQLEDVASALPRARGHIGDRLLVLAGGHAHWLSWDAWRNGRPDAAHAWLNVGFGLAAESSSADLMSWMWRIRAVYAAGRDDPARALSAAESAISVRHQSPAAAAVALHALAMATAACGDHQAAARAAEGAYKTALRVPDPAERPEWLYWLDPVRAQIHLGDTAYAIGDYARAVDIWAEAVPQLDQFPKDQAVLEQRLETARRYVASD
jgi:transcriptional regulator with XRE-family HTH domain